MTGGDTDHYTTEDEYSRILYNKISDFLFIQTLKLAFYIAGYGGYSSVVELSTADRRVLSSNLSAPFN